ncbi:uncharacterized protein [Notamacropus eugenii]|uniref:uncharacterized protein n=1 Tax=Notamacropus eugenii TaxID=9315 RepID=UPI003B67345C
MRKIFKILRRRERSPSGSSSPRRDSEVRPLVPGAGYVIRMKDLGKIHKAASFGDVARVQHLLLLGQAHVDDLDKEKRTPLHLASANGHPDVVSLLVERKCKINLRDKNYQTSLMKAVQCQQEECARILLDYGADPALMDTHDNTALHYAASGLNTAIAAKLLRHTIDMEAKNKVEVYLLCEKIFSEIKCVNQEGCTPLLLAVKENNRDMVDLFLKNGANVNTSDRLDRTALMIAARCKPTGVVSLLLQYDIDLSCRDAFGQTAEEHAAFSGHSIHYELIYQYGQQKALNQPLSLQISSLERAADSRFTVTGPANDQEELIIDSNCCDANAITGSTPNYGFHSLIHIRVSNKAIRFVGSCDDSLERHQNVKSIQPTTEKHVYYTNDNLGNGVQEKRKSYLVEERNLDDSDDIDGSSEESQESFDKSDLEQDTVQMDANNCDDLTQSSDTATEGDDLPALNYKNVLLVMEQLSVGCDDFIKLVKNEDAILRYDRSVVRKKGHCPLLTRKVKSLENKICGLREELSETRQMVSDLEQQKAEWKRELLSTRVPGKQEEIEQDAEEKLVLKMSHQFRKKERRGEKVELRQEFQYPLRTLDLELRTETNHSKQIPDSHEKEKYLFDKNQILEDENAMLKLEVDTLKIKNRDKENHIEILKEKNDYLHQKLQLNAEILTAIRVQYSEEARERNLQREVPVSGNYQSMRIVSQQVTSFYRRNYEEKEKLPKQVDETKSKVPVRNVKEEYLQEKKEIIQYEVAMHKVELKTVKIKDQRTRTHHREETEALKEKNEELQQELQWNREALRKIRFQYSGQVKVLKAENAALNSQLENAKENTERLESEIESYRSRLMSVIDDYEQSEASKLALEHSFQEARDEWLHVQDKLNSDLSILRENHAFLSEELSQAESGAKSLENELGHVQESLREKTYILENTQRELNHAEEKAKELEETNQMLKEKVKRYSLENASLQERLGQIQSENTMLQQELEDTQKKVTIQEKQLSDAQVSLKNEKEKYLQKTKEIAECSAMFQVKLQTVIIKYQRARKHQTEKTGALKEKIEELQQELQWNREALRKIGFQCRRRVHVLKAEDATLNSKLQNAEQNIEKLEDDRASYASRLIEVGLEYELSKLALEDSFDRERHKWLHLKDKLNRDWWSQREDNAVLSEKLSKVESRAKSLENELDHVQESLTEKTYIVENTQRELNHAEEKAKELEETNQVLKEKVNRYSLENASLQERLGQIQSENTVLQQELEDTQKKVTIQEKQLSDAQVSLRNEKEKYLQKTKEIAEYGAMHQVELHTVKINYQHTRKHHTEETEALKEMIEELQQELQWNREALRKIGFQCRRRVNVLKAENATLNSKLQNAEHNIEKLEDDRASYASRLIEVGREYELSKLALEDSFEGERDEWLHLKDKLNRDWLSLREDNGVLSEKLSKTESRAKSLENELDHVQESLTEKTYIVENTQRELNHAEEKAKELEETNQVLKEKVNRYSLENESLQERLGQIQSENTVLQQELEDTQKKIIFHEKQIRDAQARVRNLQRESPVSCNYQFLTGVSQQVTSFNEIDYEDKEKLKKEVDETKSQLRIEREKFTRLNEWKQCLEDSLERQMKRNDELEEDLNR